MRADIQDKLSELIDFAEENGLTELSWADGGFQISFRRAAVKPAAAVAEANGTPALAAEPEAKHEYIKSPMVGTFRRATSKDRPPMVVDGDHVKPGDRLGIVESMKIPTEVISVLGGVIKKILVEDGQPVEYGQPLIEVEPETAHV